MWRMANAGVLGSCASTMPIFSVSFFEKDLHQNVFVQIVWMEGICVRRAKSGRPHPPTSPRLLLYGFPKNIEKNKQTKKKKKKKKPLWFLFQILMKQHAHFCFSAVKKLTRWTSHRTMCTKNMWSSNSRGNGSSSSRVFWKKPCKIGELDQGMGSGHERRKQTRPRQKNRCQKHGLNDNSSLFPMCAACLSWLFCNCKAWFCWGFFILFCFCSVFFFFFFFCLSLQTLRPSPNGNTSSDLKQENPPFLSIQTSLRLQL